MISVDSVLYGVVLAAIVYYAGRILMEIYRLHKILKAILNELQHKE